MNDIVNYLPSLLKRPPRKGFDREGGIAQIIPRSNDQFPGSSIKRNPWAPPQSTRTFSSIPWDVPGQEATRGECDKTKKDEADIVATSIGKWLT